jgi:hypothetical protein
MGAASAAQAIAQSLAAAGIALPGFTPSASSSHLKIP